MDNMTIRGYAAARGIAIGTVRKRVDRMSRDPRWIDHVAIPAGGRERMLDSAAIAHLDAFDNTPEQRINDLCREIYDLRGQVAEQAATIDDLNKQLADAQAALDKKQPFWRR